MTIQWCSAALVPKMSASHTDCYLPAQSRLKVQSTCVVYFAKYDSIWWMNTHRNLCEMTQIPLFMFCKLTYDHSKKRFGVLLNTTIPNFTVSFGCMTSNKILTGSYWYLNVVEENNIGSVAFQFNSIFVNSTIYSTNKQN